LLQSTALGGESWQFADRTIPVGPRFASNSGDAVIALALAGQGLAWVLSYQVADALEDGRLEVVLAKHAPDPVPIQLVYPSARMLSATTRAFLDLASARRWNFA
jgi:DNA-binding transcriptional LysR family regulator